MRKIINECVQCDLPCIDCGRKHVEALFCDRCNLQINDGYRFEGEDYCEYCLLDLIIKRYFDSREAIEKFYNSIGALNEEDGNFSYDEMINDLNVDDLDDLIKYLGIAARPIGDWAFEE